MGPNTSPAGSPAAISPWSQVAALVALMTVVVGALLTAFAWPTAQSAVHDVPIALAGPAPAVEQVVTAPGQRRPGSFGIIRVTGTAAAEAAMLDREVDEAIDVSTGKTHVLPASAASLVVAQTPRQIATAPGQATGSTPATTVPVPDITARPTDGPRGAGLAAAALPLVAGIAATSLLTLRVRDVNGRRAGALTQVAGALTFAGTGGFAIAAIMEVSLHSITGDYLTDAGILALALAALAVTFLGFRALEKAETVQKKDEAGDDEAQIVRALGQPPEPVAIRVALKWRHLDEPWRGWLRRSGAGVDLFNRWNESSEHVALLGEDAYREQLVQVLSRVVPRDCAASGFGCTRRIDRRCREPETCSQDPSGDAGEAVHREGPLPGGCDHYYGWRGDEDPLRVRFSAGNRHRAVEWDGRIWIDGVPIAEDHILDEYGDWLDDRFFVTSARTFDEASTTRSVIVHDADRGSTVIVVPTVHEKWTKPTVVRDGGVLLVYPDRTGGAPARTLPVHR
ncbi:hypothetical protein AB0G04_25445 [Actinoplanes sp. NPDC023801]|uniref:hypothetical protein n=1 Tax=Actinoplanes sp. NPDC023801 TaxID=3154595 RepID=UPI0033ED54A9